MAEPPTLLKAILTEHHTQSYPAFCCRVAPATTVLDKRT